MTVIEEQLHRRQHEFLQDESKFRVIAAGRRSGKTHATALAARNYILQNKNNLLWWAAPTYTQAEIGFQKFLNVLPDRFKSDEAISRQRRTVDVLSNRIEFKSSDRPDNLRGEGVDLLIIDEAAQVGEYAWQNALRPTLTDNPSSRMVAISTPKGRNWFWHLFQRGQNPDESEYASWQFPTTENPFISQSDVEEAQRTLPERVYRQEYLAEFVDDSGGVFKGVRKRNVEDYNWKQYSGESPYRIGVDLARTQDYTVITVLDAMGKLTHFDRVRDVSWSDIQHRVMEIYSEYRGEVRIDATRDNKIIQDLEQAGVDVEPVRFTAQRKRELVENLMQSLEKQEIVLPKIPALINELEIFEFEQTRTGNVRYQAPDGFHDDCVDSLALAAQNAEPASIKAAFI